MAKKIGMVWILNLFITIGHLLWNAITLFSYVFKGIATIFTTVWNILKPVYEAFKTVYNYVYDFYVQYVKPELDFVEGIINKITAVVDSVYNELLGGIQRLYNETFGWYENLRKNVDDITGKIERIVAVFDSKLAANIKATEDKFFLTIDKYTRDVRDWAVEQIRDAYLLVRSEMYEITGAINSVIKPIKEFGDAMQALIPPTIEKPTLLSRETMNKSGSLYGDDLFAAYFNNNYPDIERAQMDVKTTQEVMTWLDATIEEAAHPEGTAWEDVDKFIGEEIDIVITGNVPAERTKIEIGGE